MKTSKILISALSAGILSVSMAFATPQQAVSQVKGNADQVLSILKKANGSNNAQVRQQAENYAMPYFDFQRMTERAVGKPWRSATRAQQQALEQQFKTLLIRTYSGTMLKFKNASVAVDNTPVVNKGGKEVIVRTKVTVPGGKPTQIDYTMYQSGNVYRVSNVSVEGASLVTAYRSQFNQIISQSGIDGLIRELKAKNGR